MKRYAVCTYGAHRVLTLNGAEVENEEASRKRSFAVGLGRVRGRRQGRVDSIATVRISHFVSQSANAFKSAVKVANRRTGSKSRSAGTATKISSAPMSIPAASDRSTGSFTSRFWRFLDIWTSFETRSSGPECREGKLPNEIIRQQRTSSVICSLPRTHATRRFPMEHQCRRGL
jgi:hypothetical protein